MHLHLILCKCRDTKKAWRNVFIQAVPHFIYFLFPLLSLHVLDIIRMILKLWNLRTYCSFIWLDSVSLDIVSSKVCLIHNMYFKAKQVILQWLCIWSALDQLSTSGFVFCCAWPNHWPACLNRPNHSSSGVSSECFMLMCLFFRIIVIY